MERKTEPDQGGPKGGGGRRLVFMSRPRRGRRGSSSRRGCGLRSRRTLLRISHNQTIPPNGHPTPSPVAWGWWWRVDGDCSVFPGYGRSGRVYVLGSTGSSGSSRMELARSDRMGLAGSHFSAEVVVEPAQDSVSVPSARGQWVAMVCGPASRPSAGGWTACPPRPNHRPDIGPRVADPDGGDPVLAGDLPMGLTREHGFDDDPVLRHPRRVNEDVRQGLIKSRNRALPPPRSNRRSAK